MLGGLSRDVALSAAVPNIGAWARNPVMYELGQTTLSRSAYQGLRHLDPISRGRALVQANGGGLGGGLRAAFGTNWGQVGNTVGTGLTPGANLAGIAGLHAADSLTSEDGSE